jgi:hypothetical protein
MFIRATLLLAVLLGAIQTASCSESDTAAQCADALTQTQAGIDALCSQAPYKASQYCRICVANGFYSVDDSCTCQSLTFNTDYCYYAIDAAAEPAIRTALDYAVQVCSDRAAVLPYSCSELDAASEGGAVTCPLPRQSQAGPDGATGGHGSAGLNKSPTPESSVPEDAALE